MATATLEPQIDDPLPHQVPGGKGRYSLGKALRQVADTRGPKGVGVLDGIELEVSQELARRSGKPAQGFYLPLDAPVFRQAETRDLTSSTGAGAVATRTDSARLIDLLRAKSVLGTLGARMPVVASGNLRLPRRTATAAVSWLAEGASPGAENSQTLDALTATPHTAGIYTDCSRALLVSQPMGAGLVIEDLALALAAELDRVGLNGAGASDEPEGIRQNASVVTVAIDANGGAPTWALVCQLEQALGDANADVGSLGLVTTPAARSKLRRTEKASGSGLIWGDDNRVAGMPALATGSMPADLTKGSGTALSSLIMGTWSDLMTPVWGAVDVLVDPYKYAAVGAVRISAFLTCDVLVRHAASFQQVSDIVTT
jgi:HK97 family phage major capsid protein